MVLTTSHFPPQVVHRVHVPDRVLQHPVPGPHDLQVQLQLGRGRVQTGVDAVITVSKEQETEWARRRC